MRVAVTGTPGTGKTAASEAIETDFDVVHLNKLIRERDLVTGRDEDRETFVADLDAVRSTLRDRDDIIVESHLAHHLPADRVVVLRCHPAELESRLRERGEPNATVEENAESEALDVVLTEAVGRHTRDAVYEIDTTDRTIVEVAGEIEAVLADDRKPSAGTVSYVDYL